MPPIFSTLNRKAVETSYLVETKRWARVTKGTNLKSKVKVTGNERVTIVFAQIFVKCGSIYVKPSPKWSAPYSTHIFDYISPAEMLCFCDILSEIIRKWPPDRVPTFLKESVNRFKSQIDMLQYGIKYLGHKYYNMEMLWWLLTCRTGSGQSIVETGRWSCTERMGWLPSRQTWDRTQPPWTRASRCCSRCGRNASWSDRCGAVTSRRQISPRTSVPFWPPSVTQINSHQAILHQDSIQSSKIHCVP